MLFLSPLFESVSFISCILFTTVGHIETNFASKVNTLTKDIKHMLEYVWLSLKRNSTLVNTTLVPVRSSPVVGDVQLKLMSHFSLLTTGQFQFWLNFDSRLSRLMEALSWGSSILCALLLYDLLVESPAGTLQYC